MRTTDCCYLSYYISLDFYTVYEGIHQGIEEF